MRAFLLAVWSSVIALCMLVPVQAEEELSEEQPIFYPPPPNQPRLQYLAKFSSVLDVSARRKGFRDWVFGGEEKEGHLVSKPFGLAVYEGAIYVVDTRGFGYGVFDLANRRSRMVQPGGAGALQKPINITIDDDGTRYITDTGRGQVVVFDANDRYVKAFGGPEQFKPGDVAIIGDRLYVTDVANQKIHVMDKRSGEIMLSFGKPGSGPGQLVTPTNLAVAEDKTIYVVDGTNFRLQQFSTDGEFIREIGSVGTAPGTFARPKGVALDKEDRIYVVDSAFQNVQILAPEGGALMYFGEAGAGPGNLSLPTVVKIDYDNIEYFEKYAAPNFEIEYLVFVVSQFGPNKVVVFGFGTLHD